MRLFCYLEIKLFIIIKNYHSYLAILFLSSCFLFKVEKEEKQEENEPVRIEDEPIEEVKLEEEQISDINQVEQIFTVYEEMPQFPGGDDSLYSYINKNLQFPEQAYINKVEGKVYVQFVVGVDGKVTEPKVLRGIGYGCDKEAIRLLKNMPIWKPGMQNGKPVRVRFNLPVKFSLSDYKKTNST